jgi:hypothetical protein
LKAIPIPRRGNTTVSELFRNFLGDVVRREESRREFVAGELDKLLEMGSVNTLSHIS